MESTCNLSLDNKQLENEMTNTNTAAALAEAVETSNRFFDDGDFRMAEQWHLRAVELQQKLEASRPAFEPCGA